MDFISILSIFVLACFVGYYVVWSVTPALHTPLMAVTNAISSVIVVGALVASAAAVAESIAPAASAVSGDMPADPAVQEAAAGTEPGLDVAPKKTLRKKASTAKTAGDA